MEERERKNEKNGGEFCLPFSPWAFRVAVCCWPYLLASILSFSFSSSLRSSSSSSSSLFRFTAPVRTFPSARARRGRRWRLLRPGWPAPSRRRRCIRSPRRSTSCPSRRPRSCRRGPPWTGWSRCRRCSPAAPSSPLQQVAWGGGGGGVELIYKIRGEKVTLARREFPENEAQNMCVLYFLAKNMWSKWHCAKNPRY